MFKIDDACRNANVPRTIRFTEEIFDKLWAVSNKNNISFNFLVLQCCKYALDNLNDEQKA